MPVAAWELLLAALITAGAAFIQTGVGLGFAMVSVPLLALLDPALAPVPQLLLTLPMTITMAVRERHAIEFRGVGWILAGRVPGLIIGLILLKTVADSTLDLLIGLFVLGAVGVVATRVAITRRPATEFAAGVAAGTTGVVASIGGPPLALLYRDARGETLRASLATVFSIGIASSIAVRAAAGEITSTDLEVAVLLCPALVVGYLTGLRLLDRFSGRAVRRAVLVLSAVSAIGLIVRSVV